MVDARLGLGSPLSIDRQQEREIDTAWPLGRFVFTVLAATGEFFELGRPRSIDYSKLPMPDSFGGGALRAVARTVASIIEGMATLARTAHDQRHHE